jgi:predicted nucleic acid-binding protein
LRFIDSNVFLHAFLKPRRKLTQKELKIKEKAKTIVKSIEEGEEVATSTVHLSEIVNIIEATLGLEKSLGLLAWIITMDNIEIYSVGLGHYEASLPLAKEKGISANDAIAYLFMKSYGLNEIYSFDKHFDLLKDIARIPEKSEN